MLHYRDGNSGLRAAVFECSSKSTLGYEWWDVGDPGHRDVQGIVERGEGESILQDQSGPSRAAYLYCVNHST